ncbi:MAG TPA: hypothetical protein VF519_03085 [Mycobacteriales bacterium]|jgi:hypothetical protein
MRRLPLAAAALAAAAAFAAPNAALACTLETCPGTSVVCTRVNCHVCYYKPEGARECIV